MCIREIPGLLTFVILLLFVGQIHSQNVTFVTTPPNTFVRVNGTVLNLSKQRALELAPGTYEAEFWAPNFEVEKKTIKVEVGKPTVVRKAMKKLSAEFNAHRDEISRYNTELLKRGIGDGAFILTPLALAYGTLRANSNGLTNEESELVTAEADILRARVRYENSIDPVFIEFARQNYEDSVERFEKLESDRNTFIVVGSVLTVITTGLTIRYFTKWRKKLARPVLKKDNPFVHQTKPTISPSFGLTASGSGKAGFIFNF